jgi:hypothetical protein
VSRGGRTCALEDGQLSAQQQDFDVVALVRSHEQADEIEEDRDQLSEYREEHRTSASFTMWPREW